MFQRYFRRGALAIGLMGLIAATPAITPAAANELERGLWGYNRAEYAAAHRWYLAAAEQGEAKAQNNLGTLYEHGRCVESDRDLAICWYEEATRNSNRNARPNLVRLHQSGDK
ncbi:MAG: tetratricopeptide repeat protein [Alphaproteobacteria bacterium]